MITNDVPMPLVDSARKANLVVFVGAGMSVDAGGLTWTQLCERLLREIPNWRSPCQTDAATLSDVAGRVADTADKQALLRVARNLNVAGDGPTIAEAYELKHGRNALIERLKEATVDLLGPPPLNVRLVSRLPCQVSLTTNYDDLLVEGIETERKRPRVVVDDLDVAYWSTTDLQVIKMHGSLKNPFKPDSIVFSREDYEKYEEVRPNVCRLIEFLVGVSTFLFVGYSLGDPNFAALYGRVQRSLGKHKRLAYLVEFGTDEHKQQLWRRRGVHLINLPGVDRSGELQNWLEGLLAAM